jgi:hypothetical protein
MTIFQNKWYRKYVSSMTQLSWTQEGFPKTLTCRSKRYPDIGNHFSVKVFLDDINVEYLKRTKSLALLKDPEECLWASSATLAVLSCEVDDSHTQTKTLHLLCFQPTDLPSRFWTSHLHNCVSQFLIINFFLYWSFYSGEVCLTQK